MSNIEALRSILNKYELEDTTEAIEFLDAIEEEETKYKDQVSSLEQTIKEYENDDENGDENELKYDNRDFVGLDTINWKLDNRNLVIQQKMEYFVESLKKQNVVGSSFKS